MAVSALSPEVKREFDAINQNIRELRSEILKNSTPPVKDYYRPNEVCQRLGISRSRFERFKNEGLFTTRKVGGSIYVAAADLEKFLPKPK